MVARTEGVNLKADGTIEIVFDGSARHLRRPKLKEFRHWAERLRDLALATDKEMEIIREGLERLKDADEEEKARIERETDEATLRRLEYTIPWTAGVVAELSDKPLPEDPDDWPAWLALDASVPAKILGHWRTAPLAPSEVPRT